MHGPATTVERLVSRGYTNAEKTLAANYMPGDTVAFHRPYKRLGVAKGDELRVASVDRRRRTVNIARRKLVLPSFRGPRFGAGFRVPGSGE